MSYSQDEIEKNLANLATMSPEEIADHYEICRVALARFKGNINELESAIGMLFIAPHFGWKPLALIHSKKTFKKYEEILGVNFRERFPEEGLSVSRSLGYELVRKLGNFWRYVSGEAKSDELKQVRRDVA